MSSGREIRVQGAEWRHVDKGFELFESKVAEPLPREAVLREVRQVDLEDPGQLLTFMHRYGPICSTERQGAGLALLPSSLRGDEAVGLEIKALLAAVEVTQRDLWVSEDVVRLHFRALWSLVDHWLAHQEQDSGGIVDAWELNGWNRPKSLAVAWMWWSDFVNKAVAPFTVRVDVEDDYGRVGRGNPYPTAYSALVMQLVELVADGTPWKRCAFDGCEQLFARQIGRAQRDQTRSFGVLYCSASHAKAQAQRNYRRNQRAKRSS